MLKRSEQARIKVNIFLLLYLIVFMRGVSSKKAMLIKKYRIELLVPAAIVTCKKNVAQSKKSKNENILFLSVFDMSLNNVYKIKLHNVNIQKPIPNHGPPSEFPPPYSKRPLYCLKYRFRTT